MKNENLDNLLNDVDTNNAGTDDAQSENQNVLTQEKVDEIVKKKTGKYIAKNAELQRQLETYSNANDKLDELASLVSTFSGIEGDALTQTEFLKNYLEGQGVKLPDKKEKNINTTQKAEETETDAYVKAKRFAENSTDDEFIEEVERLQNKSNKSNADKVKLEQYNTRYGVLMFNKDKAIAKEWYDKKGGNFDELLKDDNFVDFAKELQIPLTKAVKQWVKLKGDPINEEKKRTVSTGSAKDTGGNMAKDFYSREEVEKMTREEIRKNLDIIHKSQSKW